MEVIKRLYRNALYSFKGIYGFLQPQIYVLVNIVNPVFQILFFSLIAKDAYGSANITPYIMGNAFVLCSVSAFFGVGSVMIAERRYGTLKNIIASPCSKFSVFTSKGLFYILDGCITVFIGIVTGILFLNVRISLPVVPFLILAIISAIFATCSMGLLIGSIGLVTRDINMLLNMSYMILMALTGVNFPTEMLPIGLSHLSNILPLTHALKAVKALINNVAVNGNYIIILIVKEVLIGIGYCVLAYVVFKIMEHFAKIRATVDIY